jgi:hypothetical protein
MRILQASNSSEKEEESEEETMEEEKSEEETMEEEETSTSSGNLNYKKSMSYYTYCATFDYDSGEWSQNFTETVLGNFYVSCNYTAGLKTGLYSYYTKVVNEASLDELNNSTENGENGGTLLQVWGLAALLIMAWQV